MSAETTPSFNSEDIEYASHLGFDAAYDQAVCSGSFDDSTSCGMLPSHAWPRVPKVSIQVHAHSPSQAFATDKIQQLGRLIEDANKAQFSPRYVITSAFETNGYRTLPKRDPDQSLSDLIDRIRSHPKVTFAERIATRLDYLLEVSREEQPEQAPPSAASLEDFLTFLSQNTDLAYPAIVLTGDGNIRVQWRPSRTEHFAIEFQGNADVRFVIFAPDPKHPYKTIRAAGGATVDSAMTLAAPYGVARWTTASSSEQEAA